MARILRRRPRPRASCRLAVSLTPEEWWRQLAAILKPKEQAEEKA